MFCHQVGEKVTHGLYACNMTQIFVHHEPKFTSYINFFWKQVHEAWFWVSSKAV